MIAIEQIATAILNGDALLVRSRVQDWIDRSPDQRDLREPESRDPQLLAVAASVLELLSERLKVVPPSWTQSIAPLSEPLFLLKAAKTMPRLRSLCERESPEVLRKRCLFAPPNYLNLV